MVAGGWKTGMRINIETKKKKTHVDGSGLI
jgi:hypothetical protein